MNKILLLITGIPEIDLITRIHHPNNADSPLTWIYLALAIVGLILMYRVYLFQNYYDKKDENDTHQNFTSINYHQDQRDSHPVIPEWENSTYTSKQRKRLFRK
jgi:hypothetical protein